MGCYGLRIVGGTDSSTLGAYGAQKAQQDVGKWHPPAGFVHGRWLGPLDKNVTASHNIHEPGNLPLSGMVACRHATVS